MSRTAEAIGTDTAQEAGERIGAVTVHRDLRYADRVTGPLHLDLYLPASAERAPVCLWVHGGGWVRGSRAHQAEERLVPVAASGIAIAAVQYRLSGQAVFPAPLDDVRAAVRWLRGAADRFPLDADRIGVWGASAGGHLAALAGLCPDPADAELGDSSVQAVVPWFPTTDLLVRETDVPEGPLPAFVTGPRAVPSFEARLLGLERTTDDPELARAASPLHQVRAGAPPFLVMHGDSDGLVPSTHSRALVGALRARKVPAEFLLLGGANHWDPAFAGPAVLGAVSAFLHAMPPRA